MTLEPFFHPLGDGRFRATTSTAGPWEPGLQHAGPPCALLGRALEACAPRADMVLARVTFEILGAVPVGEVVVAAAVTRPGRSVELLEATLEADGRTAVAARAWRVGRRGAPPAGAAARPPAVPENPGPPAPFSGYADAVELRFAAGGWHEPGPATVWTRLRVPVVDGEAPSGLQRVLAVADSGNGVSAVHVRREAHGEWICLDAETTLEPDGAGLARSTLSDAEGPVAHGSQSLLVAPRPPRPM
jgi:hypothetical protein